MNVGILGLGLIGGSLARAYAKAGHSVYIYDRDSSMVSFAEIAGVIHGTLDETTIPCCDLLLLAIYTDGSCKWLQEYAHCICEHTLVIDCCGIKKKICGVGFDLAQKYGFTFIGGHPMAGSHYSGFKYSRANLFQGAPMVLVPAKYDDPVLLQRATDALSPCGFGTYSVTTAENHDKMIAFTSQMPHIVSNAYIKSPTAVNHKGFSAGSYKDLTRVAWLNPEMWAELFLSNKDNILNELNYYIDNLQKYRDAIMDDNVQVLTQLLAEGRDRKEEVDG